MDKGIIMWVVFLAVIAAGILVSRRIKSGINENGIETDAVVSRILQFRSKMSARVGSLDGSGKRGLADDIVTSGRCRKCACERSSHENQIVMKVFCQIREPIWKKDSRYGSNITLSIKTMQDWCDKRG